MATQNDRSGDVGALSNHVDTLRVAIQLAIDNDWKSDVKDLPSAEALAITAFREGRVFDLIYNHEFAQALWGEAYTQYSGDGDAGDYDAPDVVISEGWEYHLANMVVEADPLKYLASVIDLPTESPEAKNG